MVRDKLNKVLQEYLGTPYWRNKVDPDGKIIEEGPFDGKGTPQQLIYATQCAAEKEGKNYDTLSPTEIHLLQKKYNIGIECSGLVYNLLDALYQDLGHAGIYYHLTGFWREVERYGVRTVSSTNMALPENSIKINDLNKLQTGDLIVLKGHDQVGHVIFILDKQDNILQCVHNSSESIKDFVHQFDIKIIDPNQNITQQDWQEQTKDGQNFLVRFDTTDSVTGVYRPLFLCQ